MLGRARLLISCADRPGIVAAVSRFLFERGANLAHSDQHTTDPQGGRFFMRVEFDQPDLADERANLERDLAGLAAEFGMDWRLTPAVPRKRIAVFVSREEHCLLELLWQARAGDLPGEVVMVISNHADLEAVVAPWGIPYHYVPVQRGHKAKAEARQLELLEGAADVVVLARYMQVLSGDFTYQWANRAINIHHSFLPAFAGANPYEQAHQRGVKLIGATAHYVTEELDAGPIIEQGVERVDHRCSVDDLRRIGRYIERMVLARAVAWHVDDRIIVDGNKTVVFA
ncbi:MAG: formyltetrahydrofolate deformylase [Chloroflexi bacterium]|nr:formyltetrahydrofolate deformylase [Chloroflexota bacterium]